MSNRTGRREREARSRPKRGTVSWCPQGGADWVTLKLGHKKMGALFAARFSARSGRKSAGVPVGDSRTPLETDVEIPASTEPVQIRPAGNIS